MAQGRKAPQGPHGCCRCFGFRSHIDLASHTSCINTASIARAMTCECSLVAAEEDLEEKALQTAIEEVFEASGDRYGRPWATNGKATR
ncbi:hypothetical protein HGRIS_000009 [Hohenbuehelia grisea]|uniref:Uncharacterized protein n=1 Tax=Hohenbuehelia grisea TaxID=104357 RepID=A0ABR3JPY5_9AGAR